MAKFVDAVNARGEKKRVPARWIGHPVLGEGLRLAPSEAARQEAAKNATGETPGNGNAPDPRPELSVTAESSLDDLQSYAIDHDVPIGPDVDPNDADSLFAAITAHHNESPAAGAEE